MCFSSQENPCRSHWGLVPYGINPLPAACSTSFSCLSCFGSFVSLCRVPCPPNLQCQFFFSVAHQNPRRMQLSLSPPPPLWCMPVVNVGCDGGGGGASLCSHLPLACPRNLALHPAAFSCGGFLFLPHRFFPAIAFCNVPSTASAVGPYYLRAQEDAFGSPPKHLLPCVEGAGPNPDPDEKDTIWCYTTSSKKRWEYCDPLSGVLTSLLVPRLSHLWTRSHGHARINTSHPRSSCSEAIVSACPHSAISKFATCKWHMISFL